MKSYPKVVVIGAGSLFFGRQAIWQMVHSPYLQNGILALVDTDEAVLKKMSTLARMVVEQEGVNLKIEASTDRREVLKDADFVVLSFAEKSVLYRGIDCEISKKYGITMCSGDTIGPGGIFRSMRELPVILQCAKDVEELCPEAWIINYINPTTVNGIGLKRYAPQVKSFALCDAQHMPHAKINNAVRAGIINDGSEYTDAINKDFDLRIAGVNHFTWMLKATYKGVDVMPQIAQAIKIQSAKETEGGDLDAKAAYNESIGYALYEIFGKIPTVVGHTKEYVRFWQGHGVATEAIPPLTVWETEPRYKRHRDMFTQVDAFITGETPIAQYMTTFAPDHATDIIESMIGNLHKQFNINTFNAGAVTNMSDDAFLELLCDVDMNGPKPLPVGEMPRGLRGMQELVLDTHEFTAQAVATGSYELLRLAMLTDPLVSTIADAEAIIKELLEAEKDNIPQGWYR
ncbi:MAG: glycoside hydrolase family 4 [Hyphomonadaceae bacterium]|nr:glycoside hydrolase family 4 [Clostridia bacterium]